MPLCCDLCAVHRSVRQFHLNEQFKIIEDTAINSIFKNLKIKQLKKLKKLKNWENWRKNEKQWKNLKNEDKNE